MCADLGLYRLENKKIGLNTLNERKNLKECADKEFAKMKNSDGVVDRTQWIQAGGTEEMFDQLDEDKNGSLDVYELAGSLTQSALVIEGGALTVMGIGLKAEETESGKRLAEAEEEVSRWVQIDKKAGQKSKPKLQSKKQAEAALKEACAETEQMHEEQKELIMLASQCQAVLCCRVSPQQKGDITRLVKTHLDKITLGVGDGANDCDMITAAHLGVGIHVCGYFCEFVDSDGVCLQGVEGSAAVNSADFALSQFKHLQNLLFVHGRWTYRRISRAVTYFFYKNMIPTLTILFYIMVTGFSGISMYNAMVISG